VRAVGAADGGGGGTGSIRLGWLSGDLSQNRVVTLADKGIVNARLTRALPPP